MSNAQLFDAAAAILLVALGFIGFMKGFIGAAMSLVGMVGGTFFAWKFSSEGTALLLEYFPNFDETLASIAAMTIIFLCVAIIVSLISRFLSYLVRFANLSGVNRVAGMLVGLAAGFVIVLAIYGVITLRTPEAGYSWMKDSIFMGLAEAAWPYAFEFLKSCGIGLG